MISRQPNQRRQSAHEGSNEQARAMDAGLEFQLPSWIRTCL